MTDRTTRAKRALELSEKATPPPWRSMRDGNQYLNGINGRLVGASRIDELPRPYNPARVHGDPRNVSRFLDDDGDFIAESRTLLPELARDVIELEAECERLRVERDEARRRAASFDSLERRLATADDHPGGILVAVALSAAERKDDTA